MTLRIPGNLRNSLRWVLNIHSIIFTVVIGTSQTCSGPKMVRSMPCWESHALNFPSNSEWATAFSQPSNSKLVAWMEAASFGELSKKIAKTFYWLFRDGWLEWLCLQYRTWTHRVYLSFPQYHGLWLGSSEPTPSASQNLARTDCCSCQVMQTTYFIRGGN